MNEPLTTKWHPGQQVTTKVAVPAYYSGYGGAPVANLTPGTIATIDSIVPPVTGNRRYLLVVDFTDETQAADSPHRTRRAALHADEVKAI